MRQTTVNRLLVLCTIFVLVGRGYGYVFWGSPIRVLAWDEALLSPVLAVFGVEWTDYAASPQVDAVLTTGTQVIGGLLFLMGLATLAGWNARRRWLRWPLYGAAVVLLLHALLVTKDRFFHYAQFFEHSIQVATPLLLAYLWLRERPAHLLFLVRLVTALTFAAHGLYAVGFYDVPAHFVDMTITILGVTEATARQLLLVAGLLDWVVAVAVFFPRLSRYAFLYAAAWGLLTALARLAYGYNVVGPGDNLLAWVYQAVVRLPHGLIPAVGLLLERKRSDAS